MLNDPLSNVLSHVLNCEKKGKKECFVKPDSKLIRQVLKILKSNKYVAGFSTAENERSCLVKLSGAINKCGVVKPRFSVKRGEYEKFEKRYLPAVNFGFLIVSTNKGIMTHKEAIEKKLGGKLLAYCY